MKPESVASVFIAISDHVQLNASAKPMKLNLDISRASPRRIYSYCYRMEDIWI